MKILALNLPQFHEIEENNEWWGKGFTEWVNVKAAKPLFEGHRQPVVPLNQNYYNLLDRGTIAWQIELAKKYSVYGFCFYHYWFSSKKNLLQTPAELFLADKSLDLKFCFAWDNEPWTRTWSAQEGNAWSPIMDAKVDNHGKKVLVEFDYEDEIGWENHYNYLLPFFKDSRYIKKDNKS